MAHSLSAKKRVRQNIKNKARNRWRLKTMREAVREFFDKIAHGTEQEATAAFQKVSKVVDKTTAKGVIHKNQAARRKSRMSKRLKAKFSQGAKKTETTKKK
jgi:small subunit ribosomal protein S20